MAQLILRNAEGFEGGRRVMHASERYAVYRDFNAPEPIEYAGRRYRLLSVAWLSKTDECICGVVDEGDVPVMYADE